MKELICLVSLICLFPLSASALTVDNQDLAVGAAGIGGCVGGGLAGLAAGVRTIQHIPFKHGATDVAVVAGGAVGGCLLVGGGAAYVTHKLTEDSSEESALTEDSAEE